ncbi:hypothetical protein F4778DRAFT_795559 [Xylariomycetidae sp. FL2044]|nr:hypothetical protein F4778DRAFT_795559 [Xylariomycetidae sp. FL2044]
MKPKPRLASLKLIIGQLTASKSSDLSVLLAMMDWLNLQIQSGTTLEDDALLSDFVNLLPQNDSTEVTRKEIDRKFSTWLSNGVGSGVNQRRYLLAQQRLHELLESFHPKEDLDEETHPADVDDQPPMKRARLDGNVQGPGRTESNLVPLGKRRFGATAMKPDTGDPFKDGSNGRGHTEESYSELVENLGIKPETPHRPRRRKRGYSWRTQESKNASSSSPSHKYDDGHLSVSYGSGTGHKGPFSYFQVDQDTIYNSQAHEYPYDHSHQSANEEANEEANRLADDFLERLGHELMAQPMTLEDTVYLGKFRGISPMFHDQRMPMLLDEPSNWDNNQSLGAESDSPSKDRSEVMARLAELKKRVIASREAHKDQNA